MQATETGINLSQCGAITKAEEITADTTTHTLFAERFMEMRIITEMTEVMKTGTITAKEVMVIGIVIMTRVVTETGDMTMVEEGTINVMTEGSKLRRTPFKRGLFFMLLRSKSSNEWLES